MTLEDIIQFRNHDKIKFIGDPSLYAKLRTHPSDKAPEEGLPKKGKVYTIYNVYDNRVAQPSWGQRKTADNVSIRCYGGLEVDITAERAADWELVEIRHDDVEVQRKSKLGVRQAQATLKRFQHELHALINSEKTQFEYYLRDILLDKKMNLLSKLQGPDRIVADLFFGYKTVEEFLESWNKGRPDHD